MTKHFSGTITALVTPFNDAGEIDWTSLEDLVEYQVERGIDGIAAVGTTGESPTLSHSEHVEVIQKVVALVQGRVPVIAGTGSNSTREAIDLTRQVDKLGVDGFLQVAPYYNKPSQEGLFQHFSAIASVTERPLVLYSIPGRCGIAIENDTAIRLFEKHPHVSALKEAGGAVDKVSALRHEVGDEYTILSGDDGLTLPFLAAGADGVISVASNLIVQEMKEIQSLALEGKFREAVQAHQRCYPFFSRLFSQPNPVPIKAVLKTLGLIASAHVRAPLSSMPPKDMPALLQAAQEARTSH